VEKKMIYGLPTLAHATLIHYYDVPLLIQS